MKKIVVLPGGFHPFHAGHLALYQQALSKFPDADVYMAASDNQKERPFPFKVKQLLATEVAGIPKNKFVQVGGSPFNPDIITKNYNSSEDALIFVRSEKDRKEHPLPDQIRKKDGKMGYLLSYPGKDERLKPFADHGYIDYLPVAEFSGGMTSATEIRNAWPKLDELGKIELIKGMYPGAEMTVPKIKKISQILDSVLIGELVESFVDPDSSKQYWNHDDQNVGVGMQIDMPLRDNDKRGRRQGYNESIDKIRGMIEESTDDQKSKIVNLHQKFFKMMEAIKLSGFGRESSNKVVDINKVRAEKERDQERENNVYSEKRTQQENYMNQIQEILFTLHEEFAEMEQLGLMPIEMKDAFENTKELIDFISDYNPDDDFPFTESLVEKLHVKTVKLKEYFGGMRDTSAPRVLRKQEPKSTPKDFWNKIDLSETSDYIEEK